MGLRGFPQSCHLMFSSGERAGLGLASPSLRELRLGEPVFLAYGIWGALNARGGWLARDRNDLPAGVRDYVEKLVAPYFRAIVEWYEALAIGVTGGELHSIIQAHLGRSLLWHRAESRALDSPGRMAAFADLPLARACGCAVAWRCKSMSFPPRTDPYHSTNIEDGIALADEDLRLAFWQKYPAAWNPHPAAPQLHASATGHPLCVQKCCLSPICRLICRRFGSARKWRCA